jgi:Uroporphyrinogen decarboxylase (URO-D)
MMSMTLQERIRSVYRREVPDEVPYMLDLSHWFYHKNHLAWDLSKSYEVPEYELIDYHKKVGAGFYLPNMGSFFEVEYSDDVKMDIQKSDDGSAITWCLESPLGQIERTRFWEEDSYSWAIAEWGVQTEQQLKILGYALASRTYRFMPDKYQAWIDYIGDMGVCYVPVGYSGMGQMLSYWMGVEGTMYATYDWSDTVHAVVDQINQNNLKLIDVIAESPAEFTIMGDNFSGDVQPPSFFDQWSRSFYDEAIRRLHQAGKFVAVHIDGQLSGAIRMIKETGADCADAVTPKPLGDLTPQQCRDEAGRDFILSGGVSPELWLPQAKIEVFKKAVLDWLELRKQSPYLIANAGDQVPPNASEDRIEIMRDMVGQYGRY